MIQIYWLWHINDVQMTLPCIHTKRLRAENLIFLRKQGLKKGLEKPHNIKCCIHLDPHEQVCTFETSTASWQPTGYQKTNVHSVRPLTTSFFLSCLATVILPLNSTLSTLSPKEKHPSSEEPANHHDLIIIIMGTKLVYKEIPFYFWWELYLLRWWAVITYKSHH